MDKHRIVECLYNALVDMQTVDELTGTERHDLANIASDIASQIENLKRRIENDETI